MISNEEFAKELDGYLKALNFTKKERNEQICILLTRNQNFREGFLDGYRRMAIRKKKQDKINAELAIRNTLLDK